MLEPSPMHFVSQILLRANFPHLSLVFKIGIKQGIVAHTFIHSTQEAKAGRSLSSRPDRATQGDSILKTNERKQKQNERERRKRERIGSGDSRPSLALCSRLI